MKKTAISWLVEIEQKLHPTKILKEGNNLFGLSHLEQEFLAYSGSLQIAFLKLLNRSPKRARNLLSQAVTFSDKIYTYIIKLQSAWDSEYQAGIIRKLYLKILQAIEFFIEECYQRDSKFFGDIKMTSYSLASNKMRLKTKLLSLKKLMVGPQLDHKLQSILFADLKSIIESNKLSRNTVVYLTAILDDLTVTIPQTLEVENLLLSYDFNSPSFFWYFADKINSALENTIGLHSQSDLLLKVEDRLNSLPQPVHPSLLVKDESMWEQIMKYIQEKKRYIGERIKGHRQRIKDSGLSQESEKMMLESTVSVLALFIRLFIVVGIIPENNVNRIFAFYAKHYGTKRTPFISQESLQKKSTDLEAATIKKVKEILIKMLNWLNQRERTL